MTNLALKPPFTDTSFAQQRYLARAGILDLFAGLEVSGSALGELVALVTNIPLQGPGASTVGDWVDDKARAALGRFSGMQRGEIDNLVTQAKSRLVSGAAWLEAEAYLIVGQGNQTVGRICARILAKAWEGFRDFLIKAIGNIKVTPEVIREIVSDPRSLLREALKLLIARVNKMLAGMVDPVLQAEGALFKLGDMIKTTITEMLLKFGPSAFGEGIPRELNNGLYLARGISALVNTANLANAAATIVRRLGVVIAWPVGMVADIAGYALTLVVRLTEGLRLRRLVGLAKVHATENGYLANGKFAPPAMDGPGAAEREARFDRFFEDHIRWFPTAAALCILVPNGLSHPSIYLNLSGDAGYRARPGSGLAADPDRYGLGSDAIERLRRDARLYLGAVGLKFRHRTFNMDHVVSLHYRDDVRVSKSIFNYLAMMRSLN